MNRLRVFIAVTTIALVAPPLFAGHQSGPRETSATATRAAQHDGIGT